MAKEDDGNGGRWWEYEKRLVGVGKPVSESGFGQLGHREEAVFSAG